MKWSRELTEEDKRILASVPDYLPPKSQPITLGLAVSGRLARAIEGNPKSVRVSVQGANGVLLIERCGVVPKSALKDARYWALVEQD